MCCAQSESSREEWMGQPASSMILAFLGRGRGPHREIAKAFAGERRRRTYLLFRDPTARACAIRWAGSGPQEDTSWGSGCRTCQLPWALPLTVRYLIWPVSEIAAVDLDTFLGPKYLPPGMWQAVQDRKYQVRATTCMRHHWLGIGCMDLEARSLQAAMGVQVQEVPSASTQSAGG
jgi:hypothetical protein